MQVRLIFVLNGLIVGMSRNPCVCCKNLNIKQQENAGENENAQSRYILNPSKLHVPRSIANYCSLHDVLPID